MMFFAACKKKVTAGAILWLLVLCLASGTSFAKSVPSGSRVRFTSPKLKLTVTRYSKIRLQVPAGEGVAWETSDPAVATVSSKGKVRAKAAGKCYITAETPGGMTYTCRLKVKALKLDHAELSLVRGRQAVLALNNPKVKASWSSSDEAVATVDETGRIRAKVPGDCVISASYKGEAYTCALKVLPVSIDSLKETNPPGKANRKKILLAGSSSMDLWNSAPQAFAPYEVINMAVGGTRVTQWLQWYYSAIVRYKPSAVVLYVGSNDLGNGNTISGEENAGNTIRLLHKIRRKLKKVPVFYVSICPCWLRQGAWDEIAVSNRRVEAYCRKKKNLYYIDLASVFADADGKPDKALFLSDRLHPNERGYRVWRKKVGRTVRKVLKRRK